jgi:hypothetical protein
MESISAPMSAGVYLRQALLGLASASGELTSMQIGNSLRAFEQACEAGSSLDQREFGKESLTDYTSATTFELDELMNGLSKRILENPRSSLDDLFLLSVLLKLDGQHERSELVVREARSQSALLGSQSWHAIGHALQSENTIAMAAE